MRAPRPPRPPPHLLFQSPSPLIPHHPALPASHTPSRLLRRLRPARLPHPPLRPLTALATRPSTETPFALRHRLPPTLPPYALSPPTLHPTLYRGRPALCALLTAPSRPPLQLAILLFPAHTFRAILDDAHPPSPPRHLAEPAVLTAPPLPLSAARLARADTHAVLSLPAWPVALRIHYAPFRLDLVSTAPAPRLLVSLNPASHLLVHPRAQPPRPDAFGPFVDPAPRGPQSVGLDFLFPNATHLSGLPERTTPYNLPDTLAPDARPLSEPYRLYNLDVTHFELHSPVGLYGNVPLLVARSADRAAGILWLNSSDTFVDTRSSPDGLGKAAHFYSESGLIDVFLLPGPRPADVFRQHLRLTGAPAMHPLFSLGYHQCRYSYMSQADALAVNAGFDEHDIPYDVLWLDIDHTDDKRYFTWNNATFPDPTQLQEHIAAAGRKVVTIIDPHVKVDPSFPLHKLAEEKKLFVTEPDGRTYIGKCWAGLSAYFDFTSEAARAAWASRFTPKHYPHFTPHLHVWNDMNEPAVFDGPEGSMPKYVLHEGGVEHRDVHNVYGHNMIRASYEGLLAARDGKQRPFVLTRSFFAGSQRYAFVWTGDNAARWDHLASSVPMLLSLQTSGIVASGVDVGGFFFNPKPDLVVRWYQAGAFQPFFRGHSNTSTKRREPWLFGEPYTSLIRTAIKVRYALLPYWYTLFAGVARGADAGFQESAVAPPMRPLSWEFPEENDDDSRWLVGDKLMVAPVVEEGCKEHSIRLPQGAVWYDLYNPEYPGKKVPDTDQVTLASPLGRIFVLQRGGSIVPRLEKPRPSTAGMINDPYTLTIALDQEGAAIGELYMDDGESFEYEKGAFVLRRFTFGDGILDASTIAGTSRLIPSKSEVSKICVLGFGRSPPMAVEFNGQSSSFSHDVESEVLTIYGLHAEAFSGHWRLEIRDSK